MTKRNATSVTVEKCKVDKSIVRSNRIRQLNLAPTWVPRSFCRPGKRIKLHPDDYYVFGLERGGVDER